MTESDKRMRIVNGLVMDPPVPYTVLLDLGLPDERFELLQDQAYLHLPSCPRLLDRSCSWCAYEGVMLSTEVLRRERALDPTEIAKVVKP